MEKGYAIPFVINAARGCRDIHFRFTLIGMTDDVICFATRASRARVLSRTGQSLHSALALALHLTLSFVNLESTRWAFLRTPLDQSQSVFRN